MLISDSYKTLNAKLHDSPEYGTSGAKWAETILIWSRRFDTRDILDYGAGKRTLEKALGFTIKNYDPAISEISEKPSPSDLVVCGDVLEHIEPECLEEVFKDILRCTKHWALLVIATRPAKRILPDGRNAHLIQEDAAWWLEKIEKHFTVENFQFAQHECVAMVRP